MEARQKRIVESYLRVKAFLELHPAPSPASYARPKDILEDVVARLMDHGQAQAAGRRLAGAERARMMAAIRRLRREHLRPITAIAQAEQEGTPGLEKALRLPPASFGPVKLLAEATAMREAAQLHMAVFIANGRQSDFLEQLDDAMEAVRAASVGRDRSVGRRAGARRGIASELRRGRSAVRVLDTIVSVAFQDSPAVLGAWSVAKRVHVRGGSGAGVQGSLSLIAGGRLLSRRHYAPTSAPMTVPSSRSARGAAAD